MQMWWMPCASHCSNCVGIHGEPFVSLGSASWIEPAVHWNQSEGVHLAPQFRYCLGYLESLWESLGFESFLHRNFSFLLVYFLGRQQVRAELLGSLSSTWDHWIGFWTLPVKQWKGDLFVHVSVSVSAFQMKEKYEKIMRSDTVSVLNTARLFPLSFFPEQYGTMPIYITHCIRCHG